MRKSVVVLCALAALFAACHRRTPQRPAQPFDRNAFIATNLQTFLANNDLGAMAAHRARTPEARQFGATMHRE